MGAAENWNGGDGAGVGTVRDDPLSAECVVMAGGGDLVLLIRWKNFAIGLAFDLVADVVELVDIVFEGDGAP